MNNDKEIEGISGFIVNSEKDFWELKRQRLEDRIKYFIKLGIKVVVSKDNYVVNILYSSTAYPDYELEVIQVTESWLKTLDKIDDLKEGVGK